MLISSRVRGSLMGSTGSAKDLSGEDSTAIVQIELPTEEQAVQMLLSTAGMPVDTSAPKEAVELVKFCNMLPLAISIAGQLVKDLELEAAEDWDGIVTLMKEEFADGSRKSVDLRQLTVDSGPTHFFGPLDNLSPDCLIGRRQLRQPLLERSEIEHRPTREAWQTPPI